MSIKQLAFELLAEAERRYLGSSMRSLRQSSLMQISCRHCAPRKYFVLGGNITTVGGGGTALQIARELMKRQPDFGVLLEHRGSKARENFARFFPEDQFAIECISAEKVNPDSVIFTNWQSYYKFDFLRSCPSKFMLVQDAEYWFFPRGATYALAFAPYADETIKKICLGSWLTECLAKESIPSQWIRFPVTLKSAIPDRALTSRSQPQARILCYLKHSFRRAGTLLLEQLQRLPKSIGGSEIEVHVFGFAPTMLTRFRYPSHIKFLGFIPESRILEELAWADLGICYSITNVSLIPFQFAYASIPFIEFEGGGAMIKDLNGLPIFAKASMQGLENAISTYVSHSEIYIKSAAEARGRFQHQGIEESVDDLMQILKL